MRRDWRSMASTVLTAPADSRAVRCSCADMTSRTRTIPVQRSSAHTDVQKISVAAGNLTYETFKQYTELVGHVNVSAATDNFSEATGRLVLDTDAYKGFIINMSDVTAIINIILQK